MKQWRPHPAGTRQCNASPDAYLQSSCLFLFILIYTLSSMGRAIDDSNGQQVIRRALAPSSCSLTSLWFIKYCSSQQQEPDLSCQSFTSKRQHWFMCFPKSLDFITQEVIWFSSHGIRVTLLCHWYPSSIITHLDRLHIFLSNSRHHGFFLSIFKGIPWFFFIIEGGNRGYPYSIWQHESKHLVSQ